MIHLTRRYRFCASHRLHSSHLNEEQNRDLYGKCNNPHGHGHDYVMEITVAGSVHPQTGLLLRLNDLDTLVGDCVLADLDYSNLNLDVPEFAAQVPTSENVVLAIQRRLRENWPNRFGADGPQLEGVRLQETKRNRFELKS